MLSSGTSGETPSFSAGRNRIPAEQGNVRTWTCEGCGTSHVRDVNAAKNLLAAGRAVQACGAGVRPQRSSPGGQSVMKQEVSRREP
ncbi:zinc ribbon domain-containing protein [Streptomyces sp. NPDC054796]